ncbi:MAG TPA: putative bacteriocin precursor [Clostridiaceae bacterium]|nr:putative bacteriocin precursor [Clostridiaceae bacterium]
MMKKLRKRNYLINDTVEAFACNCSCGCDSAHYHTAEVRVTDKVVDLETDY